MMVPDHCAMGAIGKFLRRSNREKLLAAIAAAALIEARIELKLIGFRHRRWFEQSGSLQENGGLEKRRESSVPLGEIAWAVKAASAHIPGLANCLVRALALSSIC
jgi:hypothetical protein